MATETQGSVDARKRVESALEDAVRRGASDIHLEPTADGYELRLRIDGLLESADRYDTAEGRAAVTRLMVMAQLLTYRLDVPQEGRLTTALPALGRTAECRVAVMPTTHGLRAAVRLPAELTQPRKLGQLGLPSRVLDGLGQFADSDTGLLLITGPAGSGKTTTIYALLEHLAERWPGLSIIALEDPVERDLPGVTQIEVSPFGELTYERALRSILRQDPQVLMLGEVRDRSTAALAVQAALSGHRLIATLHAGTPAGAIARLLEMGIEPYQLTSALFAVMAQRLVRRRSETGEGYAGRAPIAELAYMDDAAKQAILGRADASALRRCLAQQDGYRTLHDAGRALVEAGETDQDELARVLGADG